MVKKSEIIWPFPPFMSYANWEYDAPEVKKQQIIFESISKKPSFQNIVSGIRRKRNVNPVLTNKIKGCLVQISKLQKIPRSAGQIKKLDKKMREYYSRLNPIDVIKIIDKFHLPYLWYGIINQYILKGKVSHLIGVKCEPFLIKDAFHKTRMFIEIFPDTTIEDIRKAWNRVLSFQKQYLEYRRKNVRKSKVAEIHNTVAELYSDGKTTKEIEGIIPQLYPDYEFMQQTLRKIKERKRKSGLLEL